ncbi:MAG: HEPN domain-containing protein [Euryarchaeota archaeon]|nr:HEPN domain-containing protein [Euryarchaeota archaeon]
MTREAGRTAAGRPADALRHWAKARRFLEGARHSEEGGHWEAAVSSAILSGIHLADAIGLHYTGRRSAGERHEAAGDRLEAMEELEPAVRRSLARHLRALLEVKNLVQYSGDASRASDAQAALQHVERMMEAATAIAKRAGWRPEA